MAGGGVRAVLVRAAGDLSIEKKKKKKKKWQIKSYSRDTWSNLTMEHTHFPANPLDAELVQAALLVSVAAAPQRAGAVG